MPSGQRGKTIISEAGDKTPARYDAGRGDAIASTKSGRNYNHRFMFPSGSANVDFTLMVPDYSSNSSKHSCDSTRPKRDPSPSQSQGCPPPSTPLCLRSMKQLLYVVGSDFRCLLSNPCRTNLKTTLKTVYRPAHK